NTSSFMKRSRNKATGSRAVFSSLFCGRAREGDACEIIVVWPATAKNGSRKTPGFRPAPEVGTGSVAEPEALFFEESLHEPSQGTPGDAPDDLLGVGEDRPGLRTRASSSPHPHWRPRPGQKPDRASNSGRPSLLAGRQPVRLWSVLPALGTSQSA